MKKLIIALAMLLCYVSAQSQVVPIVSLKQNNSQGVPLDTGQYKTVTGIITAANEFGGPSYMQDNTGGIAVFYQEMSAAVKIGDSVIVTAKLTQFNGLTELTFTTTGCSFTKIDSNKTVTPLVINFQQFTTQDYTSIEPYEGLLLRFNNVTTTATGTFAANTNYPITDVTGTYASTFRIDNNTNLVGTAIPTGTFSVICVGSQFKSGAPYQGGYQVLPRFTNDLILGAGPNILNPPVESSLLPNSVTITWTTQNASDSKIYYMRSDSNYQPVVFKDSVYDAAPTNNHVLTINNLRPGRIYYMKASSTNGSGTSLSSGNYFSTSSDPTSTGKWEVYFNKSVDTSFALPNNKARGSTDLKTRLIQRIDSAKYSIDFAIYSFNDITQIRDALIQAVARGVKLRIVYDSRTNQSLMQDLINAGILVQKRNQSTGDLMHNKFMIFDSRDTTSYKDDWLWGGSANITNEQFNTDQQNVVFIQDQALCATYTREFEEMWGSHNNINNPSLAKFGPYKTDNTPHLFNVNGRRIDVYFSPSDNPSTQIENMIANYTNKSISFVIYAFTRFNISNKMKTQFSPPTKMVRGVFDVSQATAGTVYEEMKGIGGTTPWNPPAPVYLENQTGLLHSKYMLIDADLMTSDPIVETGSFNYSNSATFGNDENFLIIHDSLMANQYYQEFAKRYIESGGTIGISHIENSVTENYYMKQNYPNPFNPTTTIEFGIPKSDFVSLKIYDMLGREVTTLVSQHLQQGVYKYTFETTGLSSGMYFYSINSGTYKQTKQMVLVK
ncbi:MAG: T9SS type A sorting domain-containing protein [Ignavibacteria bacterium]|nr:T9SS type A sorting domain-containing protein [Ignavibacteria bacterium]